MRRQYAGAAQAAQLTAGLAASTAALTIVCDDLSNWPDGTIGPFYVVIDRGLANEEKILCATRSGNTLTVYDDGLTNGRAADDTSLSSHNSNAVIEHVFTATDANEANLHVNSESGVHGVAGDLVGTTDTQTLTNKTISQSQITNLVTDLAGKASVADLATKASLLISFNQQTASYTLALTDGGKQVEILSSSANTLTIPPNSSVAFPVGTVILFVQTGTGQTTITPGTGVTVNGTPGLKVRTQWSPVTIEKRATDTWLVMGDLSA